jgi:hypothetical protein
MGISLGSLCDSEPTMDELEDGSKGRRVVQVVTSDVKAAIAAAKVSEIYCENPESLKELKLEVSVKPAPQFYLKLFIWAAPTLKTKNSKPEKMCTTVRHLLLRLYAYLSPGTPLMLIVAYLELLSALLPYLVGRPMAPEHGATAFSPEDPTNVAIPCAASAILFEIWEGLRALLDGRLKQRLVDLLGEIMRQVPTFLFSSGRLE